MAPVPFQHPVRYGPIAFAGAHIYSVVYLTYTVADSLYTSYKSLGPAADTRSRIAQRRRLVPAFLGLAVAAISVAAYSYIASARLSYGNWAYEHGLDLPSRLVGEDGVIHNTKNSSQLYLTQWMSDTPIYHDALEIVAEKARRFWWGQQIDLATTAFSMLLSIEGRRRKIPMLSAFMVLAHLVNLSFAQNLFYVAVLLTPFPLPSGDEDLELPVLPMPNSTWTRIRNMLRLPKPANWLPSPALLFGALMLNFISTFLLPYAAETPSFPKVVMLARTTTFLPLILPKIVPVKWGAVHEHPHEAYATFTKLFRFFSLASFALHAKATFVGLVSNAPSSHYHRHSAFIPWDVEERSKWERTTTAIHKVLGSVHDHPVVAAVGWDVLICTLSLGLWAAVRATDVQDILKSAVPFYGSTSRAESTPVEDETPKTPEKAEFVDHEHGMTLRRRGRPTKSRVGSIARSSSGVSEDVTPASTRKRGRPRKVKQPEEDKAYEPTPSEAAQLAEGDELPEELDWEAGTLAWGLAAFGGLTSACAGVFGGECVSR
ncbi:Uu.00g003250.m01.CDS01 [Anthostomella pinea]|uniref:Uu.00g003250.m01.CDS01 n=1 Tax=Anthostomella pinea TaxID=933095 RepID=A0AAI8YIN9_9PEZI|nr:Uu.00g003250.m01.CDS01 [Anthostomella pinea]